MTTEVATAYIAIGASTTGLGRAANRTFSASIGNAASAASAFASRLLAPVAIATAAAGVGRFFATAVNRGSDLAETSTALSAVFGDAVAVVNDFAAAAPTALGQARQQVAEAAQMFGVYGNAAGLASNDSATFSTELVTMATDLASFYNTSPADAVEAISAGLRGEAEPLRKYGILLDDATLKAEATRQGIYDGNGPLSQQTKIIAAQGLVMQQGGIAVGDFAKTSGGLANQQRILAATWTNFTATLGAAFLPAVTSVVTLLNGSLGPVLDSIASGAQIGADWLSGALDGNLDGLASILDGVLSAVVAIAPEVLASAAEVGPGIIAGFADMYPTLVDANVSLFATLITAAATVIPQAASMVGELAPTILDAFTTLVPQLLDGAVTLFESIAAAIPQIVPPMQAAFAAVVPGVLGTVLSMVPTLLDAALMLFDALVTGVLEALPAIIDALLGSQAALIGAILTMLPSLVDAALTLFLGLTVGLLDALPTLLTGILDMLPDVLGQILAMLPALTDAAVMLFTGLVEAFPQILPELIGAVSEIVPMLLDTVAGLAPVLFDMGRQIVEGLAAGLAGSAAAVAESLVGSVGNAVDAFTDMLGINSPSTVMAEQGERTALAALTKIETPAMYAPEPSPEYLASQGLGGIAQVDFVLERSELARELARASEDIRHTNLASTSGFIAGRGRDNTAPHPRHLRAV